MGILRYFADGAIQILGLFFLKETYVAKILGTKAKRLRKEAGNTVLRTEFEYAGRNLTNTLKHSLSRPFRFIGTQIIIQLLALYTMFLYGLMYLVLSTFPTLWTKTYHESIGIGGLNYIALALGCRHVATSWINHTFGSKRRMEGSQNQSLHFCS